MQDSEDKNFTHWQARSAEMAARFPDRLREARQKLGFTLAQVSERCGLAVSSISGWERGSSSPTLAGLVSVGLALDVSIHWLASGCGPRSAAVLNDISDEQGELRCELMLIAAAERAVIEVGVWEALQPMIEEAEKHSGAKRSAILQAARRMAQEAAVDIDAGPPEDAVKMFVDQIAPYLVPTNGDDVLKVHGPPIQREGYVEQVVRHYKKAGDGKKHVAKPGSGGAKKKKRGA